MTNLEKDTAIYNELLKIANEVFQYAAEKSDYLRAMLDENGGFVSLEEILKRRSPIYSAIKDETDDATQRTVSIDTFKCNFEVMNVFSLLLDFKGLAGVKGSVTFTYTEDEKREYIDTVSIPRDVVEKSSVILDSLSESDLYPAFNNVLVEYNRTSGAVFFVATNTFQISIISNKPSEIHTPMKSTDEVYHALFRKDSWKRIYNWSKKNKRGIEIWVYKAGKHKHFDCNEFYDTMKISIGDVDVKSVLMDEKFLNWKNVLPKKEGLNHFEIHKDDIKKARKFVVGLKLKANNYKDTVSISAYKGSNLLYFDTEERSASFRLTKPSEVTVGTRLGASLATKKFTGFWFNKDTGHPIVDDEVRDYACVGKWNEGSPITPNIDEREVDDTENTHEIPETVVATEAEEEITVAKKERKYIDFCDL